MDKKNTVKDFIKQCEESYFDIDIKEVIVNKYIPFRVKLNVSKRIIENHSLKNGDIKTDTGTMYLSFVAAILRLYTKLDISATETDVDYDMLQEHGLVDDILNYIGKDLEEFRKIFAMCEEDFRTNYLSTPSFIQRQINKITGVLGKYVSALSDWLDSIDEKKLVELMNIKVKENKKQDKS